MRTLRFHRYGEPGDVLSLDDADIPEPKPGHLRVKVHACGLNPADWALCRGLFASDLPRGVGLDVAGIVNALGDGVKGVVIGEAVLGVPAYQEYPSAGVADHAVLSVWTPVPSGLSLLDAAALPMAVETPQRCLNILGVTTDHKLFVYGAGTMIGFAAVQMARLRGAKVIAAAGDTFAAQLRSTGAEVTPYGDRMVKRVRELVGGTPDLIFDAGPIGDVLPALVEIAGGDGHRIVTVSNHGPAADALGVRNSFEGTLAYDALADFASLAAQGRFTIPIACTFPLTEWRAALDASLSGHAHGKLMLLPEP
jgi:NADPH:quinone reductase-like Zn-dependent oxidoreductase